MIPASFEQLLWGRLGDGNCLDHVLEPEHLLATPPAGLRGSHLSNHAGDRHPKLGATLASPPPEQHPPAAAQGKACGAEGGEAAEEGLTRRGDGSSRGPNNCGDGDDDDDDEQLLRNCRSAARRLQSPEKARISGACALPRSPDKHAKTGVRWARAEVGGGGAGRASAAAVAGASPSEALLQSVGEMSGETGGGRSMSPAPHCHTPAPQPSVKPPTLDASPAPQSSDLESTSSHPRSSPHPRQLGLFLFASPDHESADSLVTSLYCCCCCCCCCCYCCCCCCCCCCCYYYYCCCFHCCCWWWCWLLIIALLLPDKAV